MSDQQNDITLADAKIDQTSRELKRAATMYVADPRTLYTLQSAANAYTAALENMAELMHDTAKGAR